MKRNIEFNGWSEELEEIKPDHVERLDEHANERIHQMIRVSYSSGELIEELDGISYRGVWSFR